MFHIPTKCFYFIYVEYTAVHAVSRCLQYTSLEPCENKVF